MGTGAGIAGVGTGIAIDGGGGISGFEVGAGSVGVGGISDAGGFMLSSPP